MAKKILIVEDHPGTSQMLSEVLTLDGFEAVAACDGPTALKMLKKTMFDLILLDIMMPEMSGLDVLAKLKADPKTKDIPVIIVSVKDSSADIRAGKKGGAVEYISKPFDPEELVNAIKKYTDA